MTKNTKIIIAVAAIILIAIFWKQISSLWNGSSNERNSSNEKGGCNMDEIKKQISDIDMKLKSIGCGITIPTNDPKCNSLISQKGILLNLMKECFQSTNPKNPVPISPVENFPIQCDPKHYGYDVNGIPRTQCGYKFPGPLPPTPSQQTCLQLMEQINSLKKKILTAPNPQQLSYLQQYIKKLELQYASMDCGGGPRPAPAQ